MQAEGYKGTGWDVTFATAPAAAYPLLTAHNATLACRKQKDCSLRVTRLQVLACHPHQASSIAALELTVNLLASANFGISRAVHATCSICRQAQRAEIKN